VIVPGSRTLILPRKPAGAEPGDYWTSPVNAQGKGRLGAAANLLRAEAVQWNDVDAIVPGVGHTAGGRQDHEERWGFDLATELLLEP